MTPEEIRRLVGSYATGTLTESERSALMQAALDDQDLFDELASEQELKELLDVPGVRPRLIEALTPPPPAVAPIWMRPWAWGGAVAVAALLGVFLMRPPDAPVEIAAVTAPAVSSDAPVAVDSLARKTESAPVKERAPERFNAPSDRRDQPAIAAPKEPQQKEKVVDLESALRDATPKAAGPGAGVVGGVMGGVPPEPSLKKEQDAKKDTALEARREQAASMSAPVESAPASLPAAAARAKPSVLAAKPVLTNVTGRLAFRYTLVGRTLTITPAQSGFLSVVEPQQKAAPVARRVTPGAEQRFPVPQGTASVIVTFSSGQENQAGQQQNVQQNAQQQVLRERQGAVNLEPQQDFAVVEITVP